MALLDSFTPATFFRAVEDWGAHHVLLTPSMAVLVIEDRRAQRFAPSALSTVLLAGAPVSPALVARTRKALHAEAHVAFGITEGSGFVFHRGPDEVVGAPPAEGAECAGRPLPGVAVRVRAEDGSPVAPGAVGLLHVRNDGITRGYWRNEAATAAAICDGWLDTGDIGCVDADGLVCDEEEIARACLAGLASFKRPSRVVLVDELPRNPLGKVLRRELMRRVDA